MMVMVVVIAVVVMMMMVASPCPCPPHLRPSLLLHAVVDPDVYHDDYHIVHDVPRVVHVNVLEVSCRW